MKKVLDVIIILLGLLFFKLFSSYVINEKVIKDYNNKIYDNELINTLYIFNFFEPYIAYYNKGNILYQENKYSDAIVQYKKALDKKPPEDKVCKVRVNLSLSMLANIDKNDTDSILTKLNEAQAVLYEDGCANKNDSNGKNRKAEDLDDEIEKLKKSSQDDSGDGDSGDDNSDDPEQDTPSGDINEIENELRDANDTANTNRQDNLNNREHMGNYEYYNGRRW